MPKVPTRCSKVGCRERAPCPIHPRGWASSKSPPLPSDWAKLRSIVKARKNCAICGDLGTSVDHKIPRAEGGTDDLDNLQLLCEPCHQKKTQEESKRANRRRRG